MLDTQERQHFTIAVVEGHGEITIAAAIHNARSAGERGELLEMLDWERLAKRALRDMPVHAMFLA